MERGHEELKEGTVIKVEADTTLRIIATVVCFLALFLTAAALTFGVTKGGGVVEKIVMPSLVGVVISTFLLKTVAGICTEYWTFDDELMKIVKFGTPRVIDYKDIDYVKSKNGELLFKVKGQAEYVTTIPKRYKNREEVLKLVEEKGWLK